MVGAKVTGLPERSGITPASWAFLIRRVVAAGSASSAAVIDMGGADVHPSPMSTIGDVAALASSAAARNVVDSDDSRAGSGAEHAAIAATAVDAAAIGTSCIPQLVAEDGPTTNTVAVSGCGTPLQADVAAAGSLAFTTATVVRTGGAEAA